jgi:GT2 family glycosyltransferase
MEALIMPSLGSSSATLVAMTETALSHNYLSKLSVSVVLYRGNLDHLRATLCGVRDAIVPSLQEARVYVVDQSLDDAYSTDSRALCTQIFEEAPVAWEYLKLDRNAGYGAGHNAALQRDLGEYHLILNPDVELPTNWLADSLAFLDAEPDIVLFATRGKNSQGEEEYLAKRYPTVWVLLLRAFGVRWLKDRCKEQLDHYEMRDLSTQPVAHDVPLLSGCCLLARTDALRAVRGFDERFFLYFEDYDLAMRMRDLGRVVRFGALQFVHHGGKASKKGWRHILWFTRGGVRFFSRWGWRWV